MFIVHGVFILNYIYLNKIALQQYLHVLYHHCETDSRTFAHFSSGMISLSLDPRIVPTITLSDM